MELSKMGYIVAFSPSFHDHIYHGNFGGKNNSKLLGLGMDIAGHLTVYTNNDNSKTRRMHSGTMHSFQHSGSIMHDAMAGRGISSKVYNHVVTPSTSLQKSPIDLPLLAGMSTSTEENCNIFFTEATVGVCCCLRLFDADGTC
jgi:hypothetical protein